MILPQKSGTFFLLEGELSMSEVKIVGRGVDTLVLNVCYADKQSFAKLHKVEMSRFMNWVWTAVSVLLICNGKLFSDNAEGGTRKVLFFSVLLCICCVPFSASLFVNIFPVIGPSFGVATCVTTCLYLYCMVALVATSSRCCVATLKQALESKGT